jgi:hypothetical protein
MTKHDKIFLFLVVISTALLGAVVAQNLPSVETALPGENPAPAAQAGAAATPYDPARSESVRKKFESQGLKPHEGKFWKQ